MLDLTWNVKLYNIFILKIFEPSIKFLVFKHFVLTYSPSRVPWLKIKFGFIFLKDWAAKKNIRYFPTLLQDISRIEDQNLPNHLTVIVQSIWKTKTSKFKCQLHKWDCFLTQVILHFSERQNYYRMLGNEWKWPWNFTPFWF